jgi:2',3'-cyclic-nucleotide 2'-phosphodiesterase (5'-nucleotidase family)
METTDQAPTTGAATPSDARPPRRLPTLLLLGAGLAAVSAALVVHSLSGDGPTPKPKPEPKGTAWKYEDVFTAWPKDRKPDLVLVITGETHGYLQKCGCSDPQKGGLERRYNFIQGLREQGLEVVPLDLGDVPPLVSEDTKVIHAQALLKYQTAMRAMKAMGYKAVGVGKEEFALGLLEAIAEFSLQPGNETPALLGANLLGTLQNQKDLLPKNAAFPNAAGTGSSVLDWVIVPTRSKINVGVVGIVGDPVIGEIKKIDPRVAFAPNSAKVVHDNLTALAKQKTRPELNVLLYNGPIDLAQKAAGAFPQFQVVVCRSEEAEPPGAPAMVKKSMIVRVGHKGQNLGVVGVFRGDKGEFELHYQRVTMTPDYETPDGKEKDNPALAELDRYSKLVKQRDLLTKNRRQAHPLQIANASAKYVGSDQCLTCHKNHGDAGTVWTASKHANAYNALENIAKKPGLRQFDGECIRCHTVGYDYNSGFVSAEKTPQLKNVGCESCHGPGSAHVAVPGNKQLALELSPWKVNGAGRLPDLKKFQEFQNAKDLSQRQNIFTRDETRILLRVDRICQSCHNQENDPHFTIEAFWPKVAHSLKPANNPAVPPKGADIAAPKKDEGPGIELPKLEVPTPKDGGPDLLPKN